MYSNEYQYSKIMRLSTTFIRKQHDLRYDLIVSVKEMMTAIWNLTKSNTVNIFDHYDSICERIRTVIFIDPFAQDSQVSWGWIHEISRIGEDVWVSSVGPAGTRTDNIYDYSTDEIVRIYEELENIYKFEKKNR